MENATINSIYSEYFGKKQSMLDAVDAYKDNKTILEESDKMYTLMTIVKLFCNAGYYPVSLLEKEKEIYFKAEDSRELTLDFDNIKTEKDKSLAILNALTLQSRYQNQKDKVQAVMADLNVEYHNGKGFDDLVKKFTVFCDGDKALSIKKVKHFIKHLERNEVNSYINIIFNEVLEDLQGK
ncbi:MAG: hypothetical protein IJA61_03640 [Clostridia bacterium]|nr:hypothetical protein [Clostridia bacterium]